MACPVVSTRATNATYSERTACTPNPRVRRAHHAYIVTLSCPHIVTDAYTLGVPYTRLLHNTVPCLSQKSTRGRLISHVEETQAVDTRRHRSQDTYLHAQLAQHGHRTRLSRVVIRARNVDALLGSGVLTQR